LRTDAHRSLLGHLAWHLSATPETVATEALAHILASSPSVAEEFLSEVRRRSVLDSFKALPAMAERLIPSGARPDVTILDDARRNRVFIENKFWAEMTPRQPAEYIEGLASSVPSVLLFVVPEPRVRALWKEVQQRCAGQGIELEGECCSSGMTAARIAGAKKSVLIASWAHVLGLLLGAAEASGRTSVAEDVRQLRGLTDRMASSAFLPLRPEEIEPPYEDCRPRAEYLRLVRAIVGKLDESERGSTEGLSWGGRFDPWKGHYVQVDGLGLCVGVLKTQDKAPLWCALHSSAWSGISPDDLPNLERVFAEGGMAKDDELFVPIRLESDADETRLVERAVAQVLDIAERIGQSIGNAPVLDDD